MTPLPNGTKALDWADIASRLDMEGHAILPGLLSPEQARSLSHRTDSHTATHRVPTASCHPGRGDLHPLDHPLPEPLAAWREAFYAHLAPIANHWNEKLDLGYRYPERLELFLQCNRKAGRNRSLSHLSRLGESDFLALHQQRGGEHVFPLQLVALLSAPGRDFTGGEFIMTEQRPRMQSRPMVLPLQLGDAAIIGTAQRPFRGRKGYYRVSLRHAVGRVRSGQRIGLELSFHDAP